MSDDAENDDDQGYAPARAAAAAAPKTSAGGRFDQVVEAWFVEQINNSPVSRHTDIFNYVREKVADLKRRLAKEI